MAAWTHLFTWQTWREFLDVAGASVTGFPERRWASVQQMKAGDVLLCYLLGVSRYIGILEVTGTPYLSYKPIWSGRVYPARVPVRLKLELLPEYGVPVAALAGELSYFKAESAPRAWTHHFRSAPIRETPADAELVLNALESAAEDPTFRALDAQSLAASVPLYEAGAGVVTVPDEGEIAALDEDDLLGSLSSEATHSEMQWLLLTLGGAMGLDVWVARNDRGRAYHDQEFQTLPRLLDDLPRQFDPATQRIIELIDVLWLKDGAIVAAFEIEHTSAVYSGLLRLADLVALQPNLKLRLYIVAPDERREKVFAELNRPTFSRLNPPLHSLCRYLPYSALRERLAGLGKLLAYLRPDFLDEISEGLGL
jgi:hypothetical protein